MVKPLSFKRSRISFIGNYILGISLLSYLFFSGLAVSLPSIVTFFFIVLILMFFLEPECVLFYRTYYIKEGNVSEVKGVLSKKQTAIPFTSISHTELKKGIVGKLLDFGDVVIKSHTGEITLNGLKHPEKVLKLIEKKTQERK